MLFCCLMQETTLQNKTNYYSHNIITEDQTHRATVPSAYWLENLFKPVSKFTDPLRQKNKNNSLPDSLFKNV